MHAAILTLGYTNAFSVLHVHWLVIFQKHTHIKNLERLHCECIGTEKSKFAMSHQESPLNFGTCKWVVFFSSSSLKDVVNVITDIVRHHRYCPDASFCVSKSIF